MATKIDPGRDPLPDENGTASLFDAARFVVLGRNHRVGSFHASWPLYRAGTLEELTGSRSIPTTGIARVKSGGFARVLNSAKEVFGGGMLEGRGGGRTNSAVATGGAAYEAFVGYQLNAMLLGTRAIAVTSSSRTLLDRGFQRRFDVYLERNLPGVGLQYVQVSADLDAVVVDFSEVPDEAIVAALNSDVLTGPMRVRLTEGMITGKDTSPFEGINALLTDPDVVSHLRVNEIACKTTFNDTIQQPMNWAVIQSEGAKSGGRFGPYVIGDVLGRSKPRGRIDWPTSIPENLPSIADFARFRTSFVTVPSQNVASFHAASMPVLRASTFDGGAFWGRDALPEERTVFGLADFPTVALDWRWTRQQIVLNDLLPGLTADDLMARVFFRGAEA